MLGDDHRRDELETADPEQELDELDQGDEDEDLAALGGQAKEDGLVSSGESDDDSDQTSLEELLAQRAAKRSLDEFDEGAEILNMAPEPEPSVVDPLPRKLAPIRDRQEFVCKRCHLVKPRVQLSDAARWLCRDCV